MSQDSIRTLSIKTTNLIDIQSKLKHLSLNVIHEKHDSKEFQNKII